MDAATITGITRGRRGLCVLAGILCALGVVCATTVVRATGAGHHAHGHAVAAVAVLADGHGTNIRTVDDALPAGAAQASAGSRSATLASVALRADDVASVETVRTRGPPAVA